MTPAPVRVEPHTDQFGRVDLSTLIVYTASGAPIGRIRRFYYGTESRPSWSGYGRVYATRREAIAAYQHLVDTIRAD